jgi:hypothetical protein
MYIRFHNDIRLMVIWVIISIFSYIIKSYLISYFLFTKQIKIDLLSF